VFESRPHQVDKHRSFLKRGAVLIAAVWSLLAACTPSPPELTVLVDTTKCPYLNYKRDHAECLERARSLYPLTRIQLRAQPAIYLPFYEAQRAYVIDCLEKKGYCVLKPGEWAPF
jgi:hypothetical protein